MEELFDQLKEGKGYFCHHYVDESINLDFVKNLVFDQNLRYVVGYG
jgi:gamma-glutamyl phosphate reductase